MASKGTKFAFNDDKIGAIKAPTDKGRTTYHDTKRPGLECVVTKTGNKSFYYRKWVDGEPKRKFIGRFPEIKVKVARDKADIFAGLLAINDDPFYKPPTRNSGPTFGAFFDTWLTQYAKHHRIGTWKDDKSLFNKHLRPTLGNKRLAGIAQVHIRKIHLDMVSVDDSGATQGTRRANSMLQLVSSIFSVAKQWKLFSGDNPIEGIKKYSEISRERYLLPEEAPGFFKALAHKNTPRNAADFFMLCLFTGARAGNVKAMSWDQISFSDCSWVVPSKTTKSKQPYFIPLPLPAVEILLERKRNNKEGCHWVFPANSSSGHLMNYRKDWMAFLSRSGISNMRVHDLRHTLASWQAIGGTSLAIIGKGLGHNSTSTTARYAHLEIEPVRAAMNRAVDGLLAAGKRNKEGGGK